MQILVVGGGGREHALAWKLACSPKVSEIYAAPGNAGTAQLGVNVPIDAEDIPALVQFAKDKHIDLAVIGPDDALAKGAVDGFEAEGIRAFGPTRASARLESDKAFAKRLMRQHAIPTAEARIFDRLEDARSYIRSREEPTVVKAAGLCKGKGVFVCDSIEEAVDAVEQIMRQNVFGDAGATVVVEEKLTGQEASIFAFCDGRTLYVLDPAQDHKPIGEGDTGPNTGGMGAYCPTPVIDEEMINIIQRCVLVPVVDAMQRESTPFKGLLYAGLMITAGGPKVLEFNARFGDPETQPLLMRMRSDLLDPILGVIEGTLDQVTIDWDPRPAVSVVMASEGYPGRYMKGRLIEGLTQAASMGDVEVFHAGTAATSDGRVITSGGRVLAVTALGTDLAQAKKRAYEAVEKIHFQGAYYRRDIADKALGSSSG